jgi:DNA polymerase III delta prime subunit
MCEKMNEFLFTEKFRPKTIADCVLPDRLKKVFQEYVTKEEIPNLLLSGTAGVGKTTVARALCDEIGLNYLFINSSEDRGIDMLRTKIMGYASTVSLTGGRKVIILDEADGLTPEAQDALRGAIEAFSSNCTFILTCNFKAKLKDAIHSRCSVIDFTLRNEEKPIMAGLFFKRLKDILDEEGISYDKNALAKIVEKYFPDYRRTLNELQRFASTGIDAGAVAQINDLKTIADLVGYLKDKNFGEMRKWITVNSDIDPSRIFRKIYDGMYSYLQPKSIPQCVIILAKYQYQAAFVADQEINLAACLTEIMVDCEFQ